MALGAGAETHPVRELDFETLDTSDATRVVPVEIPIAIEFNGIGYAVMMATPTDLEDFVTGFALAEGLARPEEIDGVDLFETGGGWVARANLPARSHQRLLERARSRVSESSCGICGIDSVAAALAPIDPVDAIPTVGPAAIKRALDTMRSYQKLGLATGAAHAAAFCNSEGDIVLVREDVGRHNALDKLIGALGRAGVDHREGFVLLTARCSQELVEKTVRAGIPMLATISAPSSLAIARAREGRLTLLALARSDTALVVNDPHQLFAKNRP
ncbi:sufurtransferase FdhD [Erythrobacter sp. HI0063]|jgi:formate dehydrogenase accessory protein FdhD|nr:sufurtransferase FdhD [Erythrobacter sp. HI0063]